MIDEDFELIFPFVLRRMMRRKQIRQNELSDLTGISEVSISRYVNGRRTPSVKELHKIALALDCSSDELLMVSPSEVKRIKMEHFSQK